MSLLLKALLNGGDFKDALAANGKAIQDVAARKTVRSFKVTRNNGFITTEIYPELTQVAVEATAKT